MNSYILIPSIFMLSFLMSKIFDKKNLREKYVIEEAVLFVLGIICTLLSLLGTFDFFYSIIFFIAYFSFNQLREYSKNAYITFLGFIVISMALLSLQSSRFLFFAILFTTNFLVEHINNYKNVRLTLLKRILIFSIGVKKLSFDLELSFLYLISMCIFEIVLGKSLKSLVHQNYKSQFIVQIKIFQFLLLFYLAGLVL